MSNTLNTSEMSFAELDATADKLAAAVQGGPAGAGEGDVAAGVLAQGMEVALSAIAVVSDILNPVQPQAAPQQQQQPAQRSSFLSSADKKGKPSIFAAAPVQAAPVARQTELVPMTYGQKKAAARELGKSRFVNTNVVASAATGYGVSRKASAPRDIFGKLKLTEMSIGKGSVTPRGAKIPPKGQPLSPEDAARMGLPEIAAQLAAVLRAKNEPSLNTISNSKNDPRAESALKSVSQDMQAKVAPKLRQQPPAPKPPEMKPAVA